MSDRLKELEWRADCLASRMDALADADPCWKGYEQRGTKEKGGDEVPNCVKADADFSVKVEAPQYNGASISVTRTRPNGSAIYEHSLTATRQKDGTFTIATDNPSKVYKTGVSKEQVRAELKSIAQTLPFYPEQANMRAGYSELQGLFGGGRRRR